MDTLAYGYPRVSGAAQALGYGIPRQQELIQSFANRNGYALAGWYAETHTGTTEERPALTEMLRVMIGNGVRVVIVESLDRLARDLMVQNLLLAKLAAEGLTLIAANTGEDVTAAMQADPMRRAMVQIQGVFAELDRNLLVARLRKGKDAKRAAGGRAEGPERFGALPGEATVLARIRMLHRKPRLGKRRTYAQIASILNKEGHPTRHGSLWNRGTVHLICTRFGPR